MDDQNKNMLIQVYKKEKNLILKERIHAICMIKIKELEISKVTSLFFCDPHMIANWISRYDNGLAGPGGQTLFW